MNKTLIAVVVLLVLAVGGAGVYLATKPKSTSNDASTNSTSMNNGSQSSSSNQSSNSSSTKPTETDKVSIENFAFSPASITVKKGTTVTWTNNDSASHTVTSDSNSADGGMDSKVLQKGESYQVTFNKVGTFKYHCSIHSTMSGTVTVTE